MTPPYLSIVVPCYNEEACLTELHGRLTAAAKAVAGEDYEIVLVNDGSRDRSWEMMRALAYWDSGRRSVNFMEVFDAAPQTVATGYDADAYERLIRIKHRYDPKNLFRVNQNIRPSV